MNLIDPRTVVVLAGCMSGLMCLVFYSLRQKYPASFHGLGEWSLAMLAFFVGGGLFATRGVLPDVFSVALGIFLILVGLYTGYVGTQRFFRVAPRILPHAVLLILVFGAEIWFSTVEPSVSARLRISNLAMAYLFGVHAYFLFKQPDKTFAKMFMSGVLGVTGFIQAMRLITSFTAPEHNNLFDTSTQNLIYILGFAFAALLFSISSVLLTSERLLAELDHHRLHLEELVQQRTSELIATEAKASQILESAADGLYGVNCEGIITFINPAGCQMLGYSASQVTGRSAHDIFHHSKPDGSPYPAAECPTNNALQTGQTVRVEHEILWHADGHAVPVMFAIHPLQLNGEMTGAVASFVDLSVQDAAAKARELALTAAESLARAKSEFLANMSHEIRTPMNGVLGFADIGLRNYQNSEKARNAFEKILISGNRLLGVVNEILDYSKIEAGKLRMNAVDMLVIETIKNALDTVAGLAHAKNLDLRLELAPDLPQVCVGDPLRVGQVLRNVLSNAVKFTETGTITVSASRRGDQLVFRVSDTGIGINEVQLDQIFNPFQQVDGSSTRKFGGTGLGLAICKRIAELMQGGLKVESQPGIGSTFEFFFPFVEPAAIAVEPVSSDRTYVVDRDRPLAGISILVAEDDEINQLLLEATLVGAGARVTMVGNGREAVEHTISGGPGAFDIVLMDIQMPEMGGYEATRRINELAPNLPIVGQTAHALDEDLAKCLAAGMVAHIAKPFLRSDLVALVSQVIAAVRSKKAS